MRNSKTEWIKLIVFVFSIVFVILFILAIYAWSEPLKDYFFLAGTWETYIVLFILIFVIKFIFERLLRWEARALFRRRK